MNRILVAGASGHVGAHTVRMLKEAGYTVRGLSRGALASGADEHIKADLTKPDTLRGICDGVDAVVSCAGAPLTPVPRQRDSYVEVDFEANRNLLDQAMLGNVRKFVYVSLFGGQRMMKTEYARAHEYFVLALENSGVPYTVVRPTGFFCTFLSILEMARQNKAFVIGNGQARINPIHEEEVARLCVEALDFNGTDILAGGPDIYTREEIVRLAFDVVDRTPNTIQPGNRQWLRQWMPQFAALGPDIKHLPPFLFTAAGKIIKPFHGRMAGLLELAAEVSTIDVVAPVRGEQHLRDYFVQHAGRVMPQGQDPYGFPFPPWHMWRQFGGRHRHRHPGRHYHGVN